MSRRKRSETSASYDSFLDIVANLVGILIILVVVLGMRTRDVVQQTRESAEQAASAVAQSHDELAKRQTEVRRVNEEVERLELAMRRFDAELAFADRRRAATLDLLNAAQQAWQQHQDQLSDQQIEQAQLTRAKNELESELEKIDGEIERSQATEPEVVAVEHLPTPMAKTVFGDEIHFRLKGGRLALVPIEELLDLLEQEMHRSVSPSMRSGQRDGVVGPVRNFIARYLVDAERQSVTAGGQIGARVRVELEKIVIEPVREPIGDTIDQALRPDSELAYELAGRDRRLTTVTVWVYPDSYREFRRLKEALYQSGFATAARPLPEGTPISGSPGGSRSNAQ